MPTLDRDGVQIHYETTGAATAPAAPVVLLTHGFSATSEMWASTAAALADRYRCITWDLRGHGRSGAPDDPDRYSPDLALADMAAILDTEGIDHAILIGHSLGGYLSLRFHHKHPDRVRALGLIDTGPGYRNEDGRAGWNAMCEAYAQAFEANGLDGMPSASPEVAAASHRSAAGLVHAARRILTQHDAVALEHLPAINVPTLVLVGSKDRPFLAGSEYMARKIPDAKHVVIDGAEHAPMLTHPAELQTALHSLLDEIA